MTNKKNNNNTLKFNKFDFSWAIALFGTAVGAGILFLPIRAGMGGIYPIIAMIIISIPMVFLSHRGLARFVNSTKEIKDITEVAEENFGYNFSKVIALLYVFAVYPICLAYGVGITNTVYGFMVNQMGITGVSRAWVAIVCITIMMYVMVKKMSFMLKITSIIVYPLIATLFLFSLYLIPKWNLSLFSFSYIPSFLDLSIFVWATIPVLVFSFNHSPAISSFVVDIRSHYRNDEIAEKKIGQVLFLTAITITGFSLFFALSCVLSLSADQLQEVKSQNITILSYFANLFQNNKMISYLGPLIAFTAIVSSFFGHYLAAKEGLKSLVFKQVKNLNKDKHESIVNRWVMGFVYITMIITAIANPSILGFIEDLGGPFIAMILFLMPLYAIHKVPSMKKYAGKITNVFVLVIGLLAVSGILYRVMLSIINMF